MNMDISIDTCVKSVDIGVDMDVKFHIHGKPVYFIICYNDANSH